jgi:hypothetical protein
MKHLERLTKIKGMEWRNLSEKETLIRKKKVRKKTILSLKEAIKTLQ